MKAISIIAVLLGCVLAGCAVNAPHERPVALNQIAPQFKAKAGLNRIAEAKEIATLLPRCPESRGRWWLLGFDETAGIPDFEHPSYLLPQDDLFKILGQPDRCETNWTSWVSAAYDIGNDRKNIAWELLVCFSDNHVVSGIVIKQHTPTIIRTRTWPDGSTTSVTNYLP
jgi:hypothetical protein